MYLYSICFSVPFIGIFCERPVIQYQHRFLIGLRLGPVLYHSNTWTCCSPNHIWTSNLDCCPAGWSIPVLRLFQSLTDFLPGIPCMSDQSWAAYLSILERELILPLLMTFLQKLHYFCHYSIKATFAHCSTTWAVDLPLLQNNQGSLSSSWLSKAHFSWSVSKPICECGRFAIVLHLPLSHD